MGRKIRINPDIKESDLNISHDTTQQDDNSENTHESQIISRELVKREISSTTTTDVESDDNTECCAISKFESCDTDDPHEIFEVSY